MVSRRFSIVASGRQCFLAMCSSFNSTSEALLSFLQKTGGSGEETGPSSQRSVTSCPCYSSAYSLPLEVVTNLAFEATNGRDDDPCPIEH